jgi:YD repeat-containing protein
MYDSGYRLISQQTSGGWATFQYDASGNITLKYQQDGNGPMTINAANEITTIQQGSGVTTVSYDANGNQVGENLLGSLTSYSFDNENRLVRIAFSNGTRSTYSYAGDGLRRTAFGAGGTLTTMVWDGDDYLGEV